MSDYFPQEFIEQVRSATDIVSLISEYVPLKKKGRNYFGLCPFHVEKTPSFSVNAEKQIFHCFGCGQGGNAATFLMSHDKLGFVETIKLLAKRANIRLPQREYDRKNLELTDKLYYANQMAAAYFSGNLSRTQVGKTALAYLEKRKLSGETIKMFQLGLAIEEWDGLLRFCNAKGVENQTLLADGLIIERSDGKGYYDRFKNRLMFPIFNLSGRIVAYAGRILNENDSPKYLNSPETPIYQKGKLLYGLNFSKEEIRKKRIAIIVEGYMDFLSLYQNGIQNLVASCGTAFTPDQARLLSRFSEEAILLFDSDSAGQNAVLRSVDLLYDTGLEVKVAVLPPGYDPDLYIKKFGAEKLNELVSKAISYVKFKVGLLKDKFSNLSLPEQERIILDFAETASKIGNDRRKNLFLEAVSDGLSVREEVVRQSLVELRRKQRDKSAPNDFKFRHPPGHDAWQDKFLAFVIDNPEYYKKVGNRVVEADFTAPEARSVWKLLLINYENSEYVDFSTLLTEAANQQAKEYLSELLDMSYSDEDKDKELNRFIERFELHRNEVKVRVLQEALRDAEAKRDSETAMQILGKLKELQQDKRNIIKENNVL